MLFNQKSRDLFEELCSVSEYKDGKPSQHYTVTSLANAYSTLVSRFAELKPAIDALRTGAKAWSREFEINGRFYETKTLDLLVNHQFGSSANVHRVSYHLGMLPLRQMKMLRC